MLIRRRWSWRRVPGTFSWVERLQPYVERWATTLQNLVEEVQPHDNTAWEAYIQWYTPRTRARVMYIPPQPAELFLDATRVIASTAYPVRRDQHYDTAVSLKIHRLSLMVLYILQFTNNFFCSLTWLRTFHVLYRTQRRGSTKCHTTRSRRRSLCRPRFLINPNRRSTLLTVVKSRSTWALTSKNSPTNSIEPFWLVDTLVGPTRGQRLGQTPRHP
jgi:hypothetical protein